MTHRERVLTALSHNETDRIPIDVGGSTLTSLSVGAYENLKKYLGLNYEPRIQVKRYDSALLDEEVWQMLGADTRPLQMGAFTNRSKVIDGNSFIDDWGCTYQRTPHGPFFCTAGSLENGRPDIGVLEKFDWPSPNDPGLYAGLKEKAETLRRNSDCAIVLSLPVNISHRGLFMRGFQQWHIDLYENVEFSARLMDIITDISIGIAENALALVGDNVDVIAWSDDQGNQKATFVTADTYRELIKPRHRRFMNALKSRTEKKVFLHTCGAVSAIIEDLIEIGVDILNPVQVSATNMNPAKLKEEFGDRLTFWGAINTQDVLPFKSPAEVRQEVRRMIDCLGKRGGYVLGSVNNILKEVPPENIIAMFDEARSYRMPSH